MCSNGTRVFVQESIFSDFLAKCKQRVEAIRIGDPFNANVQMGAMISAEHAEKVMGFIDRAKKEVSQKKISGLTNPPDVADCVSVPIIPGAEAPGILCVSDFL